MRRVTLWITGVLATVFLAAAAVLRFEADDPAVWHADPLEAPGGGRANAHRVGPAGAGSQPIDAPAPEFAARAADLAAAFDAFVLSQPRTARVAGGPAGLWTTYVQRSRVLGFPDYISVRFIDLGSGRATVAIHSRARHGGYDWGVNRARVEKWLAALARFAR